MPRSKERSWESICRVVGCDNPVMAKGLCSTDYARAKRGLTMVLRGSENESPMRVPWVFNCDAGEAELIRIEEEKDAAATKAASDSTV